MTTIKNESVKQKIYDLRKASNDLIKYLAENYDPHVTAIVTSTSVELVGRLINIPNILDHLKD